MQNIGQSTIKELSIPLPEEDEAKHITQKLETTLTKLDSLSQKLSIRSAILTERRTALISAAVTGKIDLRNWQPPAKESTA